MIYFYVFQLSKKYGPVFTVYLGPQKVVVLSGFKAVKEALVTNAEVFGERSAPMIAKIFTHNNGANDDFVKVKKLKTSAVGCNLSP